MRPPAPPAFRPLFLERLGAAGWITPSQRMILRNLERRPVRAAMAVAGVAGSVAILISGTFWIDALEVFIDVQFNHMQRADVNLAFVEPAPAAVRWELERLPGVREVEVSRSIPVRLHAGHRSYRTAVTGLADGAQLMQVVDARLRERPLRDDGVVLTQRLAAKLGVRPGDSVVLEMLEGRRLSPTVPVAGTVDELVGMNAWMRLTDLNRIAREGPMVSSAQLMVDRPREAELLERLKGMPAVAMVIVNRTLVETFRATTARNIVFFTTVLTIFAGIIAVGVVYNNARIQLAERAWELASLRVLGLTRAEVSTLLLGELAIEIALAIPLGCLAGYGLAALMLSLMSQEVFEIPLVMFPSTYLYAAAEVAVAGIVSALIVRHRIDRLDLVSVLKARD